MVDMQFFLLQNGNYLLLQGVTSCRGCLYTDNRHGTFQAKETLKVMKSAILSHSMKVITLVLFAENNQILVGIFKRICSDSLNTNNEHKNSLFPLRPNKNLCMFSVTCQKKIGRVGRDFFFFFFFLLFFFFYV